jgi:hypothetical protein
MQNVSNGSTVHDELSLAERSNREWQVSGMAGILLEVSFNLLSEFQRAIDPGLKTYRQLATLAFRSFTRGAIPWSKWALPLTLASGNFSEVRSANGQCRMIFSSISEFRFKKG